MNRRLRSLWPNSFKTRVVLVCLVLVVAVVVIIGFFALRAKKPQPSFDTGNLTLKLRQDQIDKLNQDSDRDGLKDWEEILYHTDPHNPDTDGDGTPDGEEIKLGRDPTKPNTSKDPQKPNDYFASATPLTDDGAAPAGAARQNLTADFTRTFLRGPLAQMLAGDQPNIDTKDVERYADRLSGRSVLIDAQHFTKADIRIDTAATAQTTTQYLASFQNIFTALNARGDNELTIISDAIQSQDYGSVALITDYPNAYQKAIDGLHALAVPKDLTDFHLTILNYLTRFKRSTELLQNIEHDPILAVLVINERIKLDDEFSAYLDNSAKKIITQVRK